MGGSFPSADLLRAEELLRAGRWRSDLTDRVSEKREKERFQESDKDPTCEKYVFPYTYSAGGWDIDIALVPSSAKSWHSLTHHRFPIYSHMKS